MKNSRRNRAKLAQEAALSIQQRPKGHNTPERHEAPGTSERIKRFLDKDPPFLKGYKP